MPEILTESFCERCGTRYTFESVAPRKTKRLGQFKTLGKGVKNWVMSDDSSLDEAMAAARSDEEREVTAQQLDAFHSTFNFCMNCRQYTCGNCWNAAEGRCLTCSPHLGHDVLGMAFPEAFPEAIPEPARLEAEAWPEVDLPGVAAARAALGLDAPSNGVTRDNGFHDEANGAAPDETFDAAARLSFLSGGPKRTEAGEPDVVPEPLDAWPAEAVEPVELEAGSVEAVGAVAAVEPVEAEEAVEAEAVQALPAETVEAVELGTEPEAIEAVAEPAADADVDVDTVAAQAAGRTSDLLARFRPGQNIDAELEAYEARLEAEQRAESVVEPTAEKPEPIAAEPEPVAVEPEPVVVEAAAPEPEPVAAAPEPEPVAADAAPTPPREDVIEQPTWRIFAPQAAPTADQPAAPPRPEIPAGPAAAQASVEPQWPARPDAAESPSMALLANRVRVSSDEMWAASAREVVGGPVDPQANIQTGVQPCSNCGLSLSANARFCRRCGTRQG